MLLSLDSLRVSIGSVEPLDDVSFAIDRGEILGVVGESGSGKSLTALAVMGLLPLIGGRVSSGGVTFDGVDLTQLDEASYRKLRGGRIGLITQNPMTSLEPVQRIGAQIDQVSRLHLGLTRAQARSRGIDLLDRLRIPKPSTIYDQYPHQLSGGMKQRIVIAMALAGDPDLLIADEPTTALDVTVQAQIILLLADLVRERDLALMLITHDMSVVAQACDRVAVMYAGRVIERGGVESIFDNPQHPYTKALVGCIPRHGLDRGSLASIPGTVPSVAQYPSGCRFHPRCSRVMDICPTAPPPFTHFSDDDGPGSDGVACYAHQDATL